MLRYTYIACFVENTALYLKLISYSIRLNWNGDECGKKTKVMQISRQPFPVRIMIVQKQLENVESFKYEVWNFNSGNYLFTTDTK